jgi:WD40 repeat protein/Ca2+-binding EF-hand superfamily protein
MEIILELNTEELDKLRKTFLSYGSLSRSEFVSIMMTLLPSRFTDAPESKLRSTKMLHDSFAQVDVNGDASMTWEEMMSALIDAGASPGRAGASRHAFKFTEHEHFAGSTSHSMRISRMKYIPELRIVVACEEGHSSFTLYACGGPRDKDPSNGLKILCELDSAVPGHAEGGNVFDVVYIPEQNLMAISVADFSIQFWDCRPLAYRMAGGASSPLALGTSAAPTSSVDASMAEAAVAEMTESFSASAGRDSQAALSSSSSSSSSLTRKSTSRTTSKSGKRPTSTFNDKFEINMDLKTVGRRRKALKNELAETGADVAVKIDEGFGNDGESDDDNDGDENDEQTEDNSDLGKAQDITIKTSGAKLPVFIKSIHCNAPQRILCWVGAANKLLSAGTNGEVIVWHTFINRVSYGVWDLRCVARGKLEVHTRQVTDMVLIHDLGMVAMSSLDETISFWGVKGLPDGLGGKRGLNESVLASSSSSSAPALKGIAAVRAAAASNVPQGGGLYLIKQHKHVHKRGVRSLLYVPSVRLLISGGYENHLQVWDMTVDDGTPKYTLLGHPLGIMGIASLESANSEYNAKANRVDSSKEENPGVSASDEGSGEGSSGAVAAGGTSSELIAMKRKMIHYSHIVSVDEGGEFRWWDVSRDMALMDDDRCLQVMVPNSVYVSRQRFQARGVVCVRLAYDPIIENAKLQKGETASESDGITAETAVIEASKDVAEMHAGCIIGIGPRLKMFEAVRQDDDRAMPTTALYHDVSTSIVAICQHDIRIYSPITGFMKRVYRSALPSEAASNCATLDGRRRKLIVGCVGGGVYALNTFNYKVVKPLPRHKADISGIIYCIEDNTVITAGWDGVINVSDELIPDGDGEKQGLLRRIRRAHGRATGITALAFDHSLSMIASAGANLTIHVFDYLDCSFLGVCAGHDSEITALSFVPSYPVLVSGDSVGVINIWGVDRGSAFVCLASMAHNPISTLSPQLREGTDEAANFAERDLRQEAIKKRLESTGYHAGLGVDGVKNLNRLACGEKLAQTSTQSPITSIAIIAPLNELESSVPGPFDSSPAFPRNKSVDAPGENNHSNSSAFPSLVVGTEDGIVSVWDLEHVLGPWRLKIEDIAQTIRSSESGVDSSSASLQTVRPRSFIEHEHHSRLMATVLYAKVHDKKDHNLSLSHPIRHQETGNKYALLKRHQEAKAHWIPLARTSVSLRSAIQKIPSSRMASSSSSYHPRKIVARTGPTQVMIRSTLFKTFDRFPDEDVELTRPMSRNSKSREDVRKASSKESAAENVISSPSSTLSVSKAELQQHLDSSDPWVFDLSQVPGAAAAANIETPEQIKARKDKEAAAAMSARETSDEADEVEALGATPSAKIPVIARAIGDLWHPTHVHYLHGVFYSLSAGDDPMLMPSSASSSSTGDKDAWKGFSVRSLKVVNSVELKCIFSSGDDGTVRILSIDGSLTSNALPVATGFKKQEGSESSRATPPASSWSLDMDIPRKEQLLNEAANATLTLLDEQQKLVQSIQTRIANGERVESFELKDIERLTRRLSIAVAEDPVMESDHKSLALQKHHSQQRDRLRRASVGKLEIERANLMGQLMGIETWEKTDDVSAVKPAIKSPLSGSTAPSTSGVAKQPAKDSPLMDPSVRTLVDLAKSDAEDLLNARLASIGKPKVYRAVKTSSSDAHKGGKLEDGENDDDNETENPGTVSTSDGAAAEALALANERDAAIKEAEMRIEKVRAAASRAEFEKAPGTVSLPGGVTIFDPAKKAQQERDVAKQRHNYPSLYAEMFKETGNAATAGPANNGEALGLVHDGMSLPGNSTLPMSPFMMANFHKIKSTPTKGTTPLKSSSTPGSGFLPLSLTSKSLSDPPLSPMPISALSSGKETLHSSPSSPLASPRKPVSGTSAAVGGAANAVAALQQLSKSNTAPERAKKADTLLSLLNSVIHEPEAHIPLPSTSHVVGKVHRSFEKVQQEIADRTSLALKDEVVKTTAQLLSERMKAREMKKKEEEAVAAAAAAAASALSMAKAFAGLVDEEKEAEAKKIAKYGAPPPKKREKKLTLAQQQLADAAARSAAMPKMSPAQYYIVNKRNRIGGQLKRDVLAFADMIRRVDEDKSGEISLDEFRAEVESGGGGLSHLGRHLESMFRAADKDGSGTLSVPELADILFAKALPAQKDEIVAFVTYQGPSPKDMAQNEKREYSQETKQQLADLFSIYDSDGSGSISVSEMEQALLAVQNLISGTTGQPTPKQMQQNREAAKKMMKLSDISGDGEVSLDEFIVLMGPSFEPDE